MKLSLSLSTIIRLVIHSGAEWPRSKRNPCSLESIHSASVFLVRAQGLAKFALLSAQNLPSVILHCWAKVVVCGWFAQHPLDAERRAPHLASMLFLKFAQCFWALLSIFSTEKLMWIFFETLLSFMLSKLQITGSWTLIQEHNAWLMCSSYPVCHCNCY